MKITCDSCGSKYTIADDKVQGRKVKVRCKNCGNNIVVDGTHGGDDASAEEAAGAADANLWTVNLTDENSRDMTTEEIVAGWASGLVTEDAYVWRDGMADWKPVLEVAELKMKLVVHPAAASPQHAVETRPEPVRAAAAFPAANPAPAAAGQMVAPRAAAAPRAQDDIFGKSWGTPSQADDDGGKRPTGARNENSVLFSLDALKAGAPEPKPKAPQRNTEDLFSMGTMPGGGLLSANIDLLTAPAQAPPPAPVVAVPFAGGAQKKSSSAPLVAAVVIALGGLGGGYYFMSKSNSTADQKVHEAEEARKQLEADLAKVRAEAEARGEDPAAAEKKAKEALAAKTETKEPAKTEAKEPAKTEPTKEVSAGAKEPAKQPASGSNGTATTSPPKDKPPAKEPSGGGGGSKSFDVAAAKAALGAAAANAASCSQPGGPKGSGKVQVTFAPSGRVTTATIIEGPFGGTAVGGCISSTFKRARVPAFDGSPTQVAKGFKL